MRVEVGGFMIGFLLEMWTRGADGGRRGGSEKAAGAWSPRKNPEGAWVAPSSDGRERAASSRSDVQHEDERVRQADADGGAWAEDDALRAQQHVAERVVVGDRQTDRALTATRAGAREPERGQ